MENLKTVGSSVQALMVFEVVARCRSITRASDELKVSQVAVSRMMARLEKALNTSLLVRGRAGLSLTADGELLNRGVSQGFGSIKQAMSEIRDRQHQVQSVVLSLSGAFIAYWLMPRFPAFQAALPHINLQFHIISGSLGGSVDEFDLAMRVGDPGGKTHQSWEFTPEVIVPVCSAAYRDAHGLISSAADLKRHTLINMSPTPLDWASFSQQAGWGPLSMEATMQFSDHALVLQAAMLGRGVALGWLSGVSYTLRTGELVAASKTTLTTGRAYRLVSNRRAARTEVKQVKEWLIEQMRTDLQHLTMLR